MNQGQKVIHLELDEKGIQEKMWRYYLEKYKVEEKDFDRQEPFGLGPLQTQLSPRQFVKTSCLVFRNWLHDQLGSGVEVFRPHLWGHALPKRIPEVYFAYAFSHQLVRTLRPEMVFHLEEDLFYHFNWSVHMFVVIGDRWIVDQYLGHYSLRLHDAGECLSARLVMNSQRDSSIFRELFGQSWPAEDEVTFFFQWLAEPQEIHSFWKTLLLHYVGEE